MFKKITYLSLAALMMAGCNLSENFDDCGVLRINMRYILNEEYTDQLATLVGDVRIYMFDSSTGLLVDVIEPTSQDIARGYTEIERPATGEFTFVAWAGGGNSIAGSGFLEVEMDDASNHLYRDLWDDDETLIDDFYIMVDHDELSNVDIMGDLRPKRRDFVDLFHSVVADKEVILGEKQTVDLDFVRNANILDITIEGIDHLPGVNTRAEGDVPLGLFLTGRNGRYQWNNAIDSDARLVRYEPETRSLNDTLMRQDIKTLRLDKVRHGGTEPMILHITDPATGRDMISPINVLSTLAKVPDGDGGWLYDTQEELDRTYRFPIKIIIDTQLHVKITINGWEVHLPDVELM